MADDRPAPGRHDRVARSHPAPGGRPCGDQFPAPPQAGRGRGLAGRPGRRGGGGRGGPGPALPGVLLPRPGGLRGQRGHPGGLRQRRLPGNPLVPVVTLPEGTTVDSPGARDALDRAFAGVAADPRLRVLAWPATTGDRRLVVEDGRTVYGLVWGPFRGPEGPTRPWRDAGRGAAGRPPGRHDRAGDRPGRAAHGRRRGNRPAPACWSRRWPGPSAPCSCWPSCSARSWPWCRC